MSDLAENKKRKGRKKCLFLIWMFIFGSLEADASQLGRFLFGIYTGWSFGLGYEFDWHSRPSRSDDYSIDLHLGGYIQYNLSERLGFQVNFNYQKGTNEWEFTYPGFPYDSGKDKISFISFDLNGVLNYLRLKNVQFYLLGGGGISSGDWESFDGLYFNFMAGTGVKIYLKSDSRFAINLGGTFHHLLDPDEYGADHANYLRFHVGFEF
jgi:hypothetical protein